MKVPFNPRIYTDYENACMESVFPYTSKISASAFLRNIRINDECSNTLMFLISQMKLIERTENLKVDLNIELGRTIL